MAASLSFLFVFLPLCVGWTIFSQHGKQECRGRSHVQRLQKLWSYIYTYSCNLYPGLFRNCIKFSNYFILRLQNSLNTGLSFPFHVAVFSVQERPIIFPILGLFYLKFANRKSESCSGSFRNCKSANFLGRPVRKFLWFIILFYSILFYSIPFCSITFHSIPFHSVPFRSIPNILFYSILLNSIPFYSILFYFILLYYILFHSMLFCSIIFCFILFFFSISFFILLCYWYETVAKTANRSKINREKSRGLNVILKKK